MAKKCGNLCVGSLPPCVMFFRFLCGLVLLLGRAELAMPREVILSNTELPNDSNGTPLITGETSILEHNGSFFV